MKVLFLMVAAIAFVKFSQKYGIKITTQWFLLLIVLAFPLSLFGALAVRPVRFLWGLLSGEMHAAITLGAVAGLFGMVKRFGVGTTLAYLLQIAMFVAAVVLAGGGAFLAVVFIGEQGGWHG